MVCRFALFVTLFVTTLCHTFCHKKAHLVANAGCDAASSPPSLPQAVLCLGGRARRGEVSEQSEQAMRKTRIRALLN